MDTQLNRIVTPDLSRSDFGRALAEQFANIDLNFQKLGNIDLSKGDNGRSCAYIIYNLNAVFVYATCKQTENSKEYNNWLQFSNMISSTDYVDKSVADYYQKIKSEVDQDYKIYYAHTGGSTEEYARMCAFLLWGSRSVFVDANTEPLKSSLTGALWASKNQEVQAPVEITDSSGKTHLYRSVWLRDWFLLGGADSWTSAGTMPQVLMDKLKIYTDHILLFDPGKITIACTPALEPALHSVGEFEPVGSLAYVYIDPRFRNENTGDMAQALDLGISQGYSVLEDISCVVYWEPRDFHGGEEIDTWDGGFKIVNLFPQIYFDGSGFYWKINGNNTRIPVTGSEGAPGKNSQFVVVERVENIMGATPTNPQGDWEYMNNHGFKDYVGPWLPDKYKQGQTIVVNAQSGRTSRVETMTGARAADFQSAYSRVPGIENQIDTTNDPDNPQAAVLSYKVVGKNGWMVGSTGTDNVEVEHTFRILRLVGKEFFWEANKDTIQENPFRPYDPTFALYNYGDPDAVQVSGQQEIQQLISSLDGCPCIVMPGPAFRPDRSDSTIWFSTLKAVRINENDTRLQLIAYCGIENQMTTNLDDHSFAGQMQELDSYTYKVTGDWRNKPRGLMLPIGSAYVYSDNKDDIWASHIMHADLGGFTKRYLVENDPHGNYYWGEQQPITDNNAKPVLGLSIPADSIDGQGYAYNTHQFLEVVRKRFIHIGSVNDYRTLNYVDGLEKREGNYNAAIPGRQRNVGHDWEALHNYAGEVSDYYGHSGFWGYDEIPSTWTGGTRWFLGSELHVDEPVTITRYRDLQRRKHLLNVEGDVTIGLHSHVNDPSIKHRRNDGGLYVQSTLSTEIIERYKYKPEEKFESIFDEQFFTGLQLDFAPFLTLKNEHTEWTSNITRSKDRNNDFENRFKDNYRGLWLTPSSDSIYPEEIDPKDIKVIEAHPSILAEDLIGSRVIAALDGIIVYDQNRTAPNSWKMLTESDWKHVRFSVDYAGNIQTYGSEIRSNNPDTFWAFHTDWQKLEANYDLTSLSGEKYTTNQRNPIHNQLIFGTSHRSVAESSYDFYWRAVNEQSYIDEELGRWTIDATKTEIVDGEPRVSFVVPARVTDMPTGWMTEIGYVDGFNSNGTPKYSIVFDSLNNKVNNMSNGQELMPTIIKMWTDVLYQQGSLTVAGLSVLPVRTAIDDVNYYTRFGMQSQFGLIIGGSGKRELAIDDDNQPVSGTDLEIPYTANPDQINCTLNDDNYGSTGAGVGQGDMTSGLSEPNVSIDMFNAEKSICKPGLWVKAGAIVDETMIIGQDLSVNRAATVRGQLRAMSFRRHINSLNVPQPDQSEKFGRDIALLSDRGWSTCNAPIHTSQEGDCFDYKTAYSPIVIDLGNAYGPYRLLRFGSYGNVRINEKGELIETDATPKDHKNCLYAVMPNQSMDNRMQQNTGYLFKGNSLNPIEVTGMTTGMMAVVIVKIGLGFHGRSRGYQKSGWLGIGSTKLRDDAWGIALPGQTQNQETSYQQGAHQCTGFNWEQMLGENFPKPSVNVDYWVGRAFDGSYNRNWTAGGQRNSSGVEQSGGNFRLRTSGELWLEWSNGIGGITKWEGQYIVLTFVYPVHVQGSQEYVQYLRSALMSTSDGQQIPAGNSERLPDDATLEQLSPSPEWPYIWKRTYVNANPPKSDADYGPWTLLNIYSLVKTEWFTSNSADVEMTAPVEPVVNVTNTVESLSESERDLFDAGDVKTYLKVMSGAQYLWVLDTTVTGAETTQVWTLLYYDEQGSEAGQTREIKVLFSGIIYRERVAGNACYDPDAWRFDRCYGPAATSMGIKFLNGAGGRMTLGFKDSKFHPTSVHCQLADNTTFDENNSSPGGNRGVSSHWFQCTIPSNGSVNVGDWGFYNGVYIWEFHQSDGYNDAWNSDSWTRITGISVTIFGYEEE